MSERGPNMRRIIRTNRLLAELGHTDTIEALECLTAERDALREALGMWLALHDNAAGYEGKYGKALDAAIASQQIKIDAAAKAARAALKATP